MTRPGSRPNHGGNGGFIETGAQDASQWGPETFTEGSCPLLGLSSVRVDVITYEVHSLVFRLNIDI